MLSGAAGQLYGSKYTDKFPSDWQSQLSTPGALQFSYLQKLFGNRQWYNLVPDERHALVIASEGRFESSGSIMKNEYVTAAITPDRSLAAVYSPSPKPFIVNMARLGGTVTARWWDPSAGAYSQINGSPFANRGTHVFSPPGKNHDGDDDWVLILETTPVQ